MEEILMGWFADGAYALGAFAVGALAAKWHSEKSIRTNMERGMRALLKAELRRIHAHAMKKGYITYEQMADAQEDYMIYHSINGNGSGTAMINDLENLPLRQEDASHD